MSLYYKVKDFKVRVSDHEPNSSMDRFRGRNDIEIYIKEPFSSKEFSLEQVEAQIERAAERNDLDIADFKEVLDGVREIYAEKENATNEMEEEVDSIPFVDTSLLSEISPQTKAYEEAVSKLRPKAAYLLSGVAKFKDRKAVLERNFPQLSNSDLNKLANENLRTFQLLS